MYHTINVFKNQNMKEKYQFVHVYSNIESIIIFTSLPTVQVQMYFI